MDWDAIVEDLGPRLYKYFCVRFSKEQSDDFTQETLIRLVRKVQEGRFDPKKGNLRMLGYGIAHYVALEAKPIEQHIQLTDIEAVFASETQFEQALMAKSSAKHLREKIKLLSKEEQQILSLLVDEELTLIDIAQIVGVPEGTIKSHIYRAKQKLINVINKEDVL